MSFENFKKIVSKTIPTFATIMARKLRCTRGVTGCHISSIQSETKNHAAPPEGTIIFNSVEMHNDQLSPSTNPMLLLARIDKLNMASVNTSDLVIATNDENTALPIVIHNVLRFCRSVITSKTNKLEFVRWGSRRFELDPNNLSNNVREYFTAAKCPQYVKTQINSSIQILDKNTWKSASISSDGNIWELKLSTLSPISKQEELDTILSLPSPYTVVTNSLVMSDLHLIWMCHQKTTDEKSTTFIWINSNHLIKRRNKNTEEAA